VSDKIPTHKLQIIVPANANEEILAFAAGLVAEGKRPWFEVRYPAPESYTYEEVVQFEDDQELVYDAVEVIDGEIITLPPYAELEAAQ